MSTRSTMGPAEGRGGRLLAATFLLALAATLGALGACQGGGGRFPTCKTDADCAERESAKEAPVCVDLRCVPCRSDEQCEKGHACNMANECRPFSDVAPEEPDGGKKEVIEKETWEASTPEDREKCLAACKGKGKECTDRCGGGAAKKPPPKK